MTSVDVFTNGRGVALVILAVGMGLRVVSSATADLAYMVLAVFAFGGRAHAVRALAVSWLLTMINEGIAAEAAHASLGRYVVVGAAAVSVALRSNLARGSTRIDRAVLTTLLLGAFLVAHSLLLSPMVDVSLLKAVSWTVAAVTILAAWSGLPDSEHERLARDVFGGLVVVLGLSVPWVMAETGYLRNGTGFQGILNHPQAFGSAMALLGAWLVAGVLGEQAPTWRRPGLLGVTVVAIVLSEARTAGVALVVGTLAGVLVAMWGSRGPIRQIVPGLFSRKIHAWLIVATAGMLFAGPTVTERLLGFLQKRTESASALEVYDTSRGLLVRRMWANIEEHPITGIGFGIASSPASMVLVNDPMLGLPTGAAVEKGVMPLAVVEELGVVGALAVAAWLMTLLSRAARGGVLPATVVCTALSTNMGEATLFSPGGMGMLILVLVGWATSRRGAPIAHAVVRGWLSEQRAR